ncbi:MAG: S-layer homology domain-containing protein [Negativicutes bacterium]|nr:S-layer homology domain-containing protein [Negativicutes bacterium]
MKKSLLKKSISITLGLAFGLSIASTALAADANAFSDVPANHWSYAAVNQLAKAGIVDGYGDKTFRGDKTITRYEMAAIVAKAVAKEDKADDAQKAMIDKLAKEYSGELKGMNVRLSKLEQNSVKVNGDVRVRYQGNWDARDFQINSTTINHDPVQREQERVRLNVSAPINKDVDATVRLSAQSYDREDLPPWAGYTNGSFGFDVAKVTFKNVLGGSAELGRNTLTIGQGLIADTPGNFDSAKYSFGGKEVKGFVAYGDISEATFWPGNRGVVHVYSPNTAIGGVPVSGNGPIWPTALATNPAVPIIAGHLAYSPVKNLTMTAGALVDKNANERDYPYEIYSLGFKTKMDNFTVTGEASRNESKQITNGQKDAFATSVMYKGADKAKVGSFGFGVGYNKFEANSVDPMLTNMTGMFNSPGKNSYPALYGAQGLEWTANYTFTKNGVLTASVANYATNYNGAGQVTADTDYSALGIPGLNTGLNAVPTHATGAKYAPIYNVRAEFNF